MTFPAAVRSALRSRRRPHHEVELPVGNHQTRPRVQRVDIRHPEELAGDGKPLRIDQRIPRRIVPRRKRSVKVDAIGFPARITIHPRAIRQHLRSRARADLQRDLFYDQLHLRTVDQLEFEIRRIIQLRPGKISRKLAAFPLHDAKIEFTLRRLQRAIQNQRARALCLQPMKLVVDLVNFFGNRVRVGAPGFLFRENDSPTFDGDEGLVGVAFAQRSFPGRRRENDDTFRPGHQSILRALDVQKLHRVCSAPFHFPHAHAAKFKAPTNRIGHPRVPCSGEQNPKRDHCDQRQTDLLLPTSPLRHTLLYSVTAGSPNVVHYALNPA